MILCALVLVLAPPVLAQTAAPEAERAARRAFHGADLEGKDGPLAKVGFELARLYHYRRAVRRGSAAKASETAVQARLPVREGHVRIDAVAAPGQTRALQARLDALGLRGGAAAGAVVSGWLPVEALAEAASLAALRFARPSRAVVRRRSASAPGAPAPATPAPATAGAVVSQGVRALRVDSARAASGADGSGVTVGVLSDSFDCLGGAAEDEAEGEIPPDVLVREISDCGDADEDGTAADEGRAMVQIVADVAPGADQRFNTAFDGIASFANGICRLAGVTGASAGSGICAGVNGASTQPAGVLVDDVLYFDEPMFAPGPIAQAVNAVYERGAAYFAAAGNSGEQSYESDGGFRDAGRAGPLGGGPLHDFNPGAGTDAFQNVTLPVGSQVTISLQWAQPYPSAGSRTGAASDLDLALVDAGGDVVENEDGTRAAATRPNRGNDPVEFLRFENDGTTDADGDGTPDEQFRLVIELAAGPAPQDLIKYVYNSSPNDAGERFSLDEYADPHSTLYGHANARGGEAIGASFYFRTPAFGLFESPIIRPFSALGGTPLYFEADGTRLPAPRTPQQPGVVGPDGVNNTFFGTDLADNFSDTGAPIPGESDDLPNFSGTSAAAPHVAGVAALMRGLNAGLAPERVYEILESTAVDMDPVRNGVFDEGFEGFGFKTGFGLVDAVAALAEVPPGLEVEVVSMQPLVVGGQATVRVSVPAESAAAERVLLDLCPGTCPLGGSGSGYEAVGSLSVEAGGTFTAEIALPSEAGVYTLRARLTDGAGTILRRGVAELTLGLGEGAFALRRDGPNPFRTRTRLRLLTATPQTIRAALYDALGRRVQTLVRERRVQANRQTFIPVEAGGRLASGVYFVRVEGEDFSETTSVVLVR